MGIILELFLTFFKIGLFTFGGGYAMISIIENICVERKRWITHEDMIQITVIAESTPGPIAINCATFVGLKQAGVPGSAAATIGVALPSFIIIYLISTVLDNFLEIQLIANAFRGIKIGVGLLIFSVGLKMAKKLPKKPLPRIIMAAAFLSLLLINIFSWNFSTISLMLMAGTLSLGVFLFRKGGADT
ncbi:MAG: chromate transporter [Oscillospiraceae bacterium]|nr:chromate transporter [Oscillospiraceae bacterium]